MENETHKFAKDIFNKMCQEKIGRLPVDDDNHILYACTEFMDCIKTFKSLNHNTKWHVALIKSVASNKLNTLSKRILKEYGSHEQYLNREQWGHSEGRPTDQRDSSKEEQRIKLVDLTNRKSNGR